MFDWYVGRGVRLGPSYSAKGRSGMRWDGIATSTRVITLEVRREGGTQHGSKVWEGSRTVNVRVRNWSLQTQNISPKNSSVISRWGLSRQSSDERRPVRAGGERTLGGELLPQQVSGGPGPGDVDTF